MEQIKMTTTEAALYITLINIGLGIVLGSIPLVLGFLRKERSYAVFGFLGSVIGGALLGLFLSLPIAVIFIWLILRRPKNIVDPPANDNLDSVENRNSENSQ